MKINDVEVQAPRWLRRAAIAALLPLTLVASAVVYADVPNAFKDGDTLSAKSLNDNFTNLDQRLVALEGRPTVVTKDGKSISTAAVFCGLSAAPQSGNLSGYAGAKAMCENIAACNSPTAHMCTAEEVLRSAALGLLTNVSGRYANGIATTYNDCNGFQTNSSMYLSPRWNTNVPQTASCDQFVSVLCCD